MSHFHASMSLHGCHAISVAQHMPENSNALTLRIHGPENSTFELTLYDLPEDFTGALIALLERQP